MNQEVKEALKNMKRFVNCKQDMEAVTAYEMKIVLQYIDQLENKLSDSTPNALIREKKEELKHKLGKTYNLYGANDYEFIKCEAKKEILEEILKEGEK